MTTIKLKSKYLIFLLMSFIFFYASINIATTIPKDFQDTTRRECSRGAKCINKYMSTETSSQQSPILKGEGYQTVNLDFQEVPVKDVLTILAKLKNMNLVLSEGVKGTVTCHLENISWNKALVLRQKSYCAFKKNYRESFSLL